MFAREIPASQLFTTVNIDDGPEILPEDIFGSFAAEVKELYSKIPSSQLGPSVQHGSRTEFVPKQGTPRCGSFARNISQPKVQNTSFVQSRHSHGESEFGRAPSSGDCPPASWFGHPHAQPSQRPLTQPIGTQWCHKEPPTFFGRVSEDGDTWVYIVPNCFTFMSGTPSTRGCLSSHLAEGCRPQLVGCVPM